MEPKLEEICDKARIDIKNIELEIRGLMYHSIFRGEQKFLNQHAEMKGNVMLVVRHLEDARMRLGKVLQYADDGISILDK